MAKSNTKVITEMYIDIKWIKKELEGNGGPGLIEKTNLNTQFRNQIKGMLTAFTMIGGTIGGVVVFIFSKIFK